jgi:hypothetical protein
MNINDPVFRVGEGIIVANPLPEHSTLRGCSGKVMQLLPSLPSTSAQVEVFINLEKTAVRIECSVLSLERLQSEQANSEPVLTEPKAAARPKPSTGRVKVFSPTRKTSSERGSAIREGQVRKAVELGLTFEEYQARITAKRLQTLGKPHKQKSPVQVEFKPNESETVIPVSNQAQPVVAKPVESAPVVTPASADFTPSTRPVPVVSAPKIEQRKATGAYAAKIRSNPF